MENLLVIDNINKAVLKETNMVYHVESTKENIVKPNPNHRKYPLHLSTNNNGYLTVNQGLAPNAIVFDVDGESSIYPLMTAVRDVENDLILEGINYYAYRLYGNSLLYITQDEVGTYQNITIYGEYSQENGFELEMATEELTILKGDKQSPTEQKITFTDEEEQILYSDTPIVSLTLLGQDLNEKPKLTMIKIPFSMTSIPMGTFSQCTNLEKVIIPNTITSIEAHAFFNCNKLTDLTLPNSITKIGSNAFEYCSNLKNINIPSNITKIELEAFKRCENIQTVVIPDTITELENGVFNTCKNLKYVTLPNTLTSIGSHAFQNCSSLTNIEIPNSVTSIDTEAFMSTSLKNVIVPNSVTEMGSGVFQDNAQLEFATLPSGMTYIPTQIFSHCTNLKSITIPKNVTEIQSFAFNGCKSLTKIDIPYNVTTIKGNAFSQCENLTEIAIRPNVTTIESGAFYMLPTEGVLTCRKDWYDNLTQEQITNLYNVYNWTKNFILGPLH